MTPAVRRALSTLVATTALLGASIAVAQTEAPPGAPAPIELRRSSTSFRPPAVIGAVCAVFLVLGAAIGRADRAGVKSRRGR